MLSSRTARYNIRTQWQSDERFQGINPEEIWGIWGFSIWGWEGMQF